MIRISKMLSVLLMVAYSTITMAADYQFCNRTGEKVFVAYGHATMYQDDVFGTFHTTYVETKGWYPIENQSCKTFTYNKSNQSVYLYAKGVSGMGYFSGQYLPRYCVHMKKSFNFKGNEMAELPSGRCRISGEDIYSVPFSVVKPGMNYINVRN